MAWRPANIPDLTDKVVFITGATSGIGLEAAHQFAQWNATLVLACRNATKAASVITSIKTHSPACSILQIPLDTADLSSVRTCVQLFSDADIPHIDILLLNAGISPPTYATSPQGFELTFATNHLGHFLLTGLLLEYISHRPNSRIISVSSLLHKHCKTIDYDLVQGKTPGAFKVSGGYSQSKLANHWFIASLNRKLATVNSPTIAVPAHPGFSMTQIARSNSLSDRIFRTFASIIGQPAEHGAWPLLMAATDDAISRTSHYGPTKRFEMVGPPSAQASFNPVVGDQMLAEELWEKCEEMCNFEFLV